MPHETVRYALEDRVAVVRLDDGRANGLSPAVLEALHQGLDRAEKEAAALLLVGREGCLSGGFDLATMRSGPEALCGLVTAGAELLLRLYGYPLPVVVACTGHAVAAGALVLLTADLRLGARGAFKIGLSEVAIGMTLPIFAIELARQRLSKRHFDRATAQAQLYPPDAAVDAGYLDRVEAAADLLELARAEATRLGALSQPAFRASKSRAHAAAIASIRGSLERDVSELTTPQGA
jgi:enoyl-CoA hydratase